MSIIQSFSRLFPYVWPYRGRLVLSSIFAVMVACLWGANLSVTFPVAQVLVEGNIEQSINKRIEQSRIDLDKYTYRVGEAEKKLQSKGLDHDLEVQLLSDLSKQQRLQAKASQQLHWWEWCKTNVAPWIPSDTFSSLAVIFGLLFVATLFKGIFVYLQDTLVGSVVELSIMDIRKDCFRKCLKQDYQTLSLEGTPGLMSKFTNDMTVMAAGLSLLGGKVIREPLKAIACLCGAFYVNWQLTLLSMLTVPVMAFIFNRFGKLLKRASHKMMESMTRIYQELEQTFDAIKVVTAFGQERQHRRRFHLENKLYYKKAMKIVRIDSLTSPVTEQLGMAAALLAVLPCTYLLLNEATSIWGIKLASVPPDLPTLATLYSLLAGIIDPVRKLSSIYTKLKRSSAATERVFAMYDRESHIGDPKSPQALPQHKQEIEFRQISFAYQTLEGESRDNALTNVNLKVPFGTVIAVLGENGSGKSTLVNLLPRYYDPREGQVLIDGVDICDVRLKDLRSQIGVVTQDTLLFPGTLKENIAYGNPKATDAEIELAAQQAGVFDFIESLEDGLETKLGSKGSGLSGGQRQRIALARAMVRDPRIMILDEATSAIDGQSEQMIQKSLKKYAPGRTIFMITHKITPTLLDLIDTIAVMDRGRLIALGDHDQLQQTCPVYQQMLKSQYQQKAAA